MTDWKKQADTTPRVTKRQQSVLDAKIAALAAWAADASDERLEAANAGSLAASYGLGAPTALKIVALEKIKRGWSRERQEGA